eukprot:CAMPEP_0204309686 /NCGR_PEP_ID=MMETSP0469-20131031/1246_1 /ASSEMBLY_ACC=CAM_ASM_000384 /TAXON_ID=2969 /ORGANISM="Oxyrrhis marina" /LENGTH=53 /DNA_ID=CAMNT_0051289337 /DNA_START=31 /DNA_END=189 /DNA_ORIENTATION=+
MTDAIWPRKPLLHFARKPCHLPSPLRLNPSLTIAKRCGPLAQPMRRGTKLYLP